MEECDPLPGIKHLAVKADERYENKTNNFLSIIPKGSAKKDLHASTIIQIWIARITSIIENAIQITVRTGTEKTLRFAETGKVVQGIQAVPFT